MEDIKLIVDKDHKIYKFGECQVILSIDHGMHHLSISHANRLPTYDELKHVRYTLLKHVKYMAQIFPPTNEFVNVHPYCLHLWEINI